MVKIFIDPGHGGTDTGATGNGLQEKALTLQIATRIRNMLMSEYNNVSILMSRTEDQTVPLSARTTAANNWGANFYLSVHINAGGGTGYEDYTYVGTGAPTTTYQNLIHEEVVKLAGLSDRGKKQADFHVLRESVMPALLTENGFIDHAADANKLKQAAVIENIAKGHVNGLARAFNLIKKTPSAPNPPTPSPGENEDKGTNSIVDYLKSIGKDSSFNSRKALANQYGIKNYTGTAKQNTDLLNKIKNGSKPGPNPTGDMKTTSVVDYLKSIKQDASFANRKKLAAQNGINNYTGTAAQNTQLLKKLRG
ncbi:N-acetylmuramoyl-L-alanine amidase [Cytobacillus purgationiresistens]|uniref:N-acetylmuramoyl-L-alanine amidase n=1 Tax=Cytobacillus purgationiresistens TaxID=863449 RepID=A0ABU0AJM2_9BACI|nr:N-acetylmuramoyl-L-alanine amidase [Cytobacillus purgationiresistens]